MKRGGIRTKLRRDYDCLVARGGCGAPAGHACKSRDGNLTQPHQARWDQWQATRQDEADQPVTPPPVDLEKERLRWIEAQVRHQAESWRSYVASDDGRAHPGFAAAFSQAAEEVEEILEVAGKPAPGNAWLEAAMMEIERAGALLREIRKAMRIG